MAIKKPELIAMAASLGGNDALEAILTALPASVPPIVIAAHFKAGLPKLVAARLNALMKLRAMEAESGALLRQGHVLLAQGGKHIKVVRKAGLLAVECFEGPRVSFAIPSGDVLFESVAKELGQSAIGIILTGVGEDGAKGLLKMRQQGAVTIGQDEKTCAVYGMPKVAKELGAVVYELPLTLIAKKILSLIGQ